MFADFNKQTNITDIMITRAFTPLAEDASPTSEHYSGLCADLSIPSKTEYYSPVDEYKWISDNCDKYGFIVRYTEDKENKTGVAPEAYHFRYVGEPHAYYMKNNNLCLEEYIEYLKTE